MRRRGQRSRPPSPMPLAPLPPPSVRSGFRVAGTSGTASSPSIGGGGGVRAPPCRLGELLPPSAGWREQQDDEWEMDAARRENPRNGERKAHYLILQMNMKTLLELLQLCFPPSICRCGTRWRHRWSSLPATPEHSTDRAGKNPDFRAEKIVPMTVPWDVAGLSFQAGLGSGRARAGRPHIL
jgi:hypothetical protein